MSLVKDKTLTVVVEVVCTPFPSNVQPCKLVDKTLKYKAPPRELHAPEDTQLPNPLTELPLNVVSLAENVPRSVFAAELEFRSINTAPPEICAPLLINLLLTIVKSLTPIE